MTAPASERAVEQARPLGPHPGGEPRANPAARWITVVIGLVFLTLSGLLARELWFLYQDVPFTSWVRPVLDFLADHVVDAVTVTIGILVSLVGLWLVITSFLPRKRTHLRVNSTASVWMRPVDIARKATATARAETGGETIRSKADRKKLTVDVPEDGTGTAQQRVAATLTSEFSRLQTPPAVTVKSTAPVQSTQPATASVSAPAGAAAETQEVSR